MNKHIVLSIAFILSCSAALFAQKAVMTVDTLQYDFGTLNEGDSAEHIFKFTNTGDVALQISEVKTTCFCTASEWPREAIAPGGSGEIKVNFDTEGKSGAYAKGINVFSNAGETNLIIFIEVISKDGSTPKPVDVPEPDTDHNHDDHSGHDHPH